MGCVGTSHWRQRVTGVFSTGIQKMKLLTSSTIIVEI